jgi:uncharacterized protein (TIGR03437 family)
MKPALLFFGVSLIARAAALVTTLANLPNTTVNAVATDAAGNIYVAGEQVLLPTTYNAFVAKLSPTGQILYSTFFSGNGFNDAYAIAVDSTGAAYIFGETSSTDFPVTPGALQTTLQAQHMQGFAAKLDPNGKVVYATFIGGSSDIGPQGILVDSAGHAILSGGTSTSGAPGAVAFPITSGEPCTSTDATTSFVMKLDPLGQKQLAAIRGIGGDIATDSQGFIYVVGQQVGVANTPIPVTPGAFQSEPNVNVCGALANFSECFYQYVSKLNPGLTQIVYSTYIAGEYGESPAAISVDAQGDAFVAGTTYSPDYPTTPNAYEPEYIASAPPLVSCFFFMSCVNLPPASGYVTELNPTGTGLIYSSFFSGTQTDTITFAAFTPNAIYVGGNASSADLPGFTGYPQQCLPQPYETRLSADGTEIGVSRVVPGTVLAYDAVAGTLIATTGTNVVAVDPNALQTSISCILDSADLQPVTSIAPGELLSLFGEFSTGSPAIPPSGQFPTSLDGVTVDLNGIPSPLLYVGGEQINFQAPFAIAGAASASIALTSPQRGISDSITLPVVASNPSAFLNTPPDASITPCIFTSPASGGTFPLALNPDGSINACTNPAPAGSIVTLFLDGLGVTSPSQTTGAITANPAPVLSSPVITANGGVTVAFASAMPGAISGIWQVGLQIPANETSGGNQVSLTAGTVPVRDVNLILWVQ